MHVVSLNPEILHTVYTKTSLIGSCVVFDLWYVLHNIIIADGINESVLIFTKLKLQPYNIIIKKAQSQAESRRHVRVALLSWAGALAHKNSIHKAIHYAINENIIYC